MERPFGPLTGTRYRIVLAVVGLGAVLAPPAASGVAKAGKCPSGQVSVTVMYVHHKGGRADSATACTPRTVTVPKSATALLAKTRAFAATFVPARVLRAFKSTAARRVAAIDGRTDAALIKVVAANSPTPTGAAASTRFAGRSAHAAAGDGNTVTNDNGTVTMHSDRATQIDTYDDQGQDFQSTTTTKATRVKGARSATGKKTLRVRWLMNKCPDAGGIARGTIDLSLRDQRTSAAVSIDQTSTFTAQVVAHFNDSAQLFAVEVNGRWSFASNSANSHRSVGGDASASNFRQKEGSNYFDLTTTTTTGTDDGIVGAGRVLGLYVSEFVVHDYIEQMLNVVQRRVHGGCVSILPDARTVHVRAGATVAIVAHLYDHHGQTFAGPMTAVNTSNRVSPTQTVGNPDATFIYAAPLTAPPGDTDVVRLTHTSKRGLSHDELVSVVIDSGRFPHQFDGSWTRVITAEGDPAFVETVHGMATYVHDPVFPPYLDGTTSIPYDVVSASVTWTVTDSGCAGSGTDDATENSAIGTTEMTLEDVSANPNVPHPEPQPFYYSLRASGNPLTAPTYHCLTPPDEPIIVDFLQIGYVNPIAPGYPADQVQRSPGTSLLEGHATSTNAGLSFDDTWRFTGSG